jgi:outer membrane receptor protein involved in Fe transport
VVPAGTRPALIWTSGSLGEAMARYKDYAAVAKVNYGNYFPSMNLSYNLTPTLVTRLSYSNTIGRPDLTSIYPGINLPDPALIPTFSNTNTYITVQNPRIKPSTSRRILRSRFSLFAEGPRFGGPAWVPPLRHRCVPRTRS